MTIRLATLLAWLLAIATLAFGEDFQCRDNDGCAATISTGGLQRDVQFRKGDVVSTDSGWVIHPDDGWAKLRGRGSAGGGGFAGGSWVCTALLGAPGMQITRPTVIPEGWIASSARYILPASEGWERYLGFGGGIVEPEPSDLALIGATMDRTSLPLIP